MATVYVRDVPEDVLAVIKVRAAKARESVQAYVRELIEREAAMPDLEEAAARARLVAAMNTPSAPVGNDDVLAAIDEGRARR